MTPSQRDDGLALADARHCEALTRVRARTFALASAFLPAPKRRGAFAVYAFCRLADDIVDEGRCGDRDAVAAAFARYRAGVDAALDGRPDGSVFREVARAAKEFGVPRAVLEELLSGIAADLGTVHFTTWAQLSAYCEGVAASVGAMCTYVFGVNGDEATRERALRFARTLGVAMQLTNILRDVGEDAAAGRCYLPDDLLAAFALTREQVLDGSVRVGDPRWTGLMRHEIARARALYRAAQPGIALLAPDAQRCARACADGYAAILGAIERNGYDSFSVRAAPGSWARAGLLWSVWTGRAAAPPDEASGPVIEWGAQRFSRADQMALVG